MSETLAKIAVEMSDLGKLDEKSTDRIPRSLMGLGLRTYANRIEAAEKQEADSIERLVRDAIIDYQEMYAHAPNDDAERELIDRAERGNAWLVAHGYEPEQLSWSKEESPCL